MRSTRPATSPKERCIIAKSGKMLVELPIDVAVVASVAVTILHVALILLLVDPFDDVLVFKY